MKIALLSNQGTLGGGEVMLFNVAEQLSALGHTPVIVGPSHHPDVLLRARQSGLRYAGIKSSGRADYLLRLRSWARASSVDLLWANGFLPATATAGMPRRVVHLHQVPAPRLQPLVRCALRNASQIIVPSQFVADRVPGSVVLPNWTADMQVLPAPTGSATGTATPVRVGFLGRLTMDKGILDLLSALSALDASVPVRLITGGSTRFASRAEERHISAALSAARYPVEQHGWTEPSRFLSQIDLLVVPSNWGEAFGLVAAEAMSAGTPLIVSDDGALPEVVGPAYPYMFPAGDVSALSHLIQDVAAHSPTNDRAALIQENRQRWEDHFSSDSAARRLERTLATLEGSL